MGYQLDESKDELVLARVSRSIYDVCFELFLCQLEIDRIIAALEFASNTCKLQNAETIEIWDQFVQSNQSIWRQIDFEKYVQSYIEERNLKQSLPSKSKARKLPASPKAVKSDIPVTTIDLEQVQRTQNMQKGSDDSGHDWMYASNDNENTVAGSTSQQSSRQSSDYSQVERVPVSGLYSRQERNQKTGSLKRVDQVDRESGSFQDSQKSKAASGEYTIHRPPPEGMLPSMLGNRKSERYDALRSPRNSLEYYDSKVNDIDVPPTIGPSPGVPLKSEIENNELEKYSAFSSELDYQRNYDAYKGNRTDSDLQLESQILSKDEQNTRARRRDTSDKSFSTAYTQPTDHYGTGYPRTNYSGTDHSGTGYSKTDYSGTDHSGTGYSKIDYSGTDHSSTGYSKTDYSGTDHSGTGYSRTDYSGTDHSGTGYSRTGHSGIDYPKSHEQQKVFQGEQRTDRVTSFGRSQPEGRAQSGYRERTHDVKKYLPAIYNDAKDGMIGHDDYDLNKTNQSIPNIYEME